MTHRNVDLHVPTLTRVEGEGAMHVVVDHGVVSDVRLEIYEPPRMFEAFLRGRSYREPVDITARICGICPVAHHMSAAPAMAIGDWRTNSACEIAAADVVFPIPISPVTSTSASGSTADHPAVSASKNSGSDMAGALVKSAVGRSSDRGTTVRSAPKARQS